MVLIAFIVVSVKAIDIRPSKESTKQYLRTDSLENMSGRTEIWAFALKRSLDRPLLGYGFTTGDHAFVRDASDSSAKFLLDTARYTLHNGYIQALLDSGIFGALLYVVVVLKALVGFYKSQSKFMSAPFFALLFLAIANLGESVMFSAATFSSLLAWYLVVFGLSIGGKRQDEKNSVPPMSPKSSSGDLRLGKVVYA